ncbi:MAG: FAD:protein FMN transferase [Candidatus Uhrbacteria bacterium]
MADCAFAFEAIGTHWKIDVFEELSAERKAALLAAIMARIEAFDRTYSRFRDDSTVMEMSKRAGTFELPEDAAPMLDVYRRLYDVTGGAFTPLIGQLMSDAGYDATYSLVAKPLSKPPAWDEMMVVEGRRVSTSRPVLLDFGAAGKGYLVDLVAEIVSSFGISAFCVDAGGDMICRGSEPTRVGLENPLATDEAIGVATIANGGICGSAGNRRAWGEFHHTIDPRTLASPRHVLATWTIAPTALIADALATCLFLVPADDLKSVYTSEYVILFADGSVERSPGAPVELFTQ